MGPRDMDPRDIWGSLLGAFKGSSVNIMYNYLQVSPPGTA